jgi:hypothetical protein
MAFVIEKSEPITIEVLGIFTKANLYVGGNVIDTIYFPQRKFLNGRPLHTELILHGNIKVDIESDNQEAECDVGLRVLPSAEPMLTDSRYSQPFIDHKLHENKLLYIEGSVYPKYSY